MFGAPFSHIPVYQCFPSSPLYLMICGAYNGSFKFKAELNFPLSANPGHIKWYVNGVEEPTAQDKIEWTKSSFPLKTPQEIKLVVIGEDGKQLTIKSTAN